MAIYESRIQKDYWKWLESKGFSTNAFHVMNEMPIRSDFPEHVKKSLNIFANNEKHMGRRKGVPDIFIDEAKQGYHGLRIELKRIGGKPSFEQCVFLHNENNNGYLAVIADTLDTAKSITNWYFNGSGEPPIEIQKIKIKGIDFDLKVVR